jgi:hypothetical protein
MVTTSLHDYDLNVAPSGIRASKEMGISMRIITRPLFILSILLAFSLIGCKAKPAPDVGFADPGLMTTDPNIPFQKFWRKPDVNWEHYRKVYIADVSTEYMLNLTEWQKGERKKQIEKDVHALALYTRDAFKKAFLQDPTQRFQVLDESTDAPETLIFELALIEVVPSKVTLNALGYAPFGIGLALNVVRGLANDRSSVAFEARVRDARTGQILMLAADREAEQATIVDLRAFKWYTHAHGIIDGWSKQFVKVTTAQPGEKIKDTSAFRLLPW